MTADTDFLDKVDLVSDQIKQLIEGKVTPEAFDRKIKLHETIHEIRKREEAEALFNKQRFGNPGPGTGDSYDWWCRGCFTEFTNEAFAASAPSHLHETPALLTCHKCNTNLISRECRSAELKEKVERLREQQAQRLMRKDRYNRWLKTKQILKQGTTDYHSWDLYEAPSDEEPPPVLPKDDPNFRAMERDLDERLARQREKAKLALKHKENGNRYLAIGDLFNAIGEYKLGLEQQRDNKALWNNKALAELKMGRFSDAVESAGKVVQICEVFEDGFTKSSDAAFKALTRRGKAFKELKKWSEAVSDLQVAIGLRPDAEATQLLAFCQQMFDNGEQGPDVASTCRKPDLQGGFETAEVFRKYPNAIKRFIQSPGPLDEILNKLEAEFSHRRKPDESSGECYLPILSTLASLSEAASVLISAKSRHLINLAASVAEKELVFDVLDSLARTPLSRKELRGPVLKSLAEFVEWLRPCNSTPATASVLLSTLANVMIGASELEKQQLRNHTELVAVVRDLLLREVAIGQSKAAGSLGTTDSCVLVSRAAALICNAIIPELTEPLLLFLSRACPDSPASRLNHHAEIKDQILNAIHNCVVSSPIAREVVRTRFPEFSKWAAKKTDARVIVIIQKCSSNLTEESEVVLSAIKILGEPHRPLKEKEAAVRLVATAYQNDSAILSQPLVETLISLICQIAPTNYLKSNEKSEFGTLRGNTSLILSHAADRQFMGGLVGLDLSIAVKPLVQILRMESQPEVQKNAGIALSKIARMEKYREAVRAVNGFESLAQIQLKLVSK